MTNVDDILRSRNDILKAYNDKSVPKFNAYLDKYCTKHKILPEVAVKHILVQVTYDMYVSTPNDGKGGGSG